eukprot:4383741-Lingulodinium_polyedra.AAC.1
MTHIRGTDLRGPSFPNKGTPPAPRRRWRGSRLMLGRTSGKPWAASKSRLGPHTLALLRPAA